MTDPRTPETKEAQLPDALDQTPAADTGSAGHGSQDAQLFAGAGQGEADVERETEAAPPGD